MSKIFSIASWVLVSIFCAAILIFSFSGQYTTVSISGNSMFPTYKNGDVVIAVKQANYALGEVIVYHPDIDCTRCNVVHRVVAGNDKGWITKGDNNSYRDMFRPINSAVHGKVLVHIPLGGYGLILVSQQFWIFLLTLILFVFYGVLFLEWFRKDKDDGEQDDTSDKTPEKPVRRKSLRLLRRARHRKAQKISIGSSVVASILALGLVASAAPVLHLTATQLQSSNKTACTAASLNVNTLSPTDNHLAVTNIPALCNGAKMTVRTVASDPASSVQSSGTISGATLNLSSGSVVATPSTVTGVVVLIDGFNTAASWIWVPKSNDPINGGGQTDGYSVVSTYSQPVGQQICTTTVVSTTSTTPITWKASLRASGVPFNNDFVAAHYQFNSPYYQFTSTTPTAGVFSIVGVGAYSTVVAGTNRTFSICNYGTPPPTGRDPNVVYTLTPGNGTAYTAVPSYYVCQTFTISSTGATKFYVGWDATIDASPLAAAYKAKSGATGTIHLPAAGDFNRVALGSNLYKISGIGWTTAGLLDGHPQSFPICWG